MKSMGIWHTNVSYDLSVDVYEYMFRELINIVLIDLDNDLSEYMGLCGTSEEIEKEYIEDIHYIFETHYARFQNHKYDMLEEIKASYNQMLIDIKNDFDILEEKVLLPF